MDRFFLFTDLIAGVVFMMFSANALLPRASPKEIKMTDQSKLGTLAILSLSFGWILSGFLVR